MKFDVPMILSRIVCGTSCGSDCTMIKTAGCCRINAPLYVEITTLHPYYYYSIAVLIITIIRFLNFAFNKGSL